MRIRTLILSILILSNLIYSRTKEDVLASNPEIAKYDSLIQVLRDSYLPMIKNIISVEDKSFYEVVDENDIPDELFLQLSKSLITCNLFHTTVKEDGDFDIYGGAGLGWMVRKQVWRRLTKPWWELTHINGYLAIEVLDDARQLRGAAQYIATCRITDDMLNNVDSDTIYVAHIGDWKSLIGTDVLPKTILIEFGLIGRVYSDDFDNPGEYTKVYSSIRDIVQTTKYCTIDGDSLSDKNRLLYKPFSSYSEFKEDINSLVKSIRFD